MFRNFRWLSKYSLGRRVMSLLGVALLSTLVIFSLSVFYFLNRAESAAWQGRQSEAARNAAGTVSSFILRVEDALRLVSVVEPDHFVTDTNEIQALLQANTALLEIVRIDSSGRVFASAARDKSVLSNLITIPQSQWFLEARQGRAFLGEAQLSAANEPYLILAVPSADTGVVAAQVQMTVLWEVVKNIRFGQAGEVMVVTQAGNIIAHTNPEFVLTRQTLLGRPELAAMHKAPNHEWSGSYTNFHNQQVVGATASVPGTNWIVITELPATEAFADSRSAIFVLGLEALLLMLIVSLIAAWYVRFQIIQPIEQLRDGTNRIGQGNLAHRIEMSRQDEIGQLATAFNAMAADLEKNQDGLQKAIAYEYEIKRANELARSNSMILALSRVAAMLENGSNSEIILDTLGSEMRKLNLQCAVATIDPAGETATIRYVSLDPALIKVFEKFTGFSLIGHDIPKRYWRGDRILQSKEPIWYSDSHTYLRELFRQIPEVIVKQIGQSLGIQAIGQICILPLISDERVIGALPIWGEDLQQADSPILAVFASQVANILQKARQYEAERQLNLTLARSKAFTSALSAIAAAFSQRQDKQRIFDILQTELAKLGLGYLIVRLSEDHQFAFVENISTPSKILSAIQKFSGVNLKGYVIERKYWESLAEEYFYHGRYLFSDNPIEFTSLVIPKISSGLLKKALAQSMGAIEQKAIYLPLITDEKAHGVLGIWGVDLQEDDAPALSVFASQVAGMLQNAVSYENETRRANELARSNSMILALSKVTAQLENSSETAKIFETVGRELKKIGIDSIIGLLDHNKQNLQIKHVSIQQEVILWAEKATEYTLNKLSIPRHLWPTDRVVTEKIAYWDPNRMMGTLGMFPILPKRLHKIALKMAGINVNDPVCYLPILDDQDVFGILAVWGAGLKQEDVPALSILANQISTAIRNNRLFETESQRARELDILLRASDATSSSLSMDSVLLTLAAQLLEISSFQSCFISEWDQETNMVFGRAEYSRTFWREERRASFLLSDYPRFKEVLLTGTPIILQGDFEAEEKKRMDQYGRTAVMILALPARGEIIGLVELATTKPDKLFTRQELQDCQGILARIALMLVPPVSANDPRILFEVEETLLMACGAEICSFSEWDRAGNQILTCAVSVDMVFSPAQSHPIEPEQYPSWKLALQEGKPSVIVRTEGNPPISSIYDGSDSMDVESLIAFPLQKGEQRIGLVELFDFNYKTQVSPEQITLLRMIADKASYWIENARLLQQTQTRLDEKTALLNEKETLLKEIHHRVKNNLQIISSLLNLQIGKVADPQTIQALRESQQRVHTMALIHEKLYQSYSLAKIDFGEYVRSLAGDLFRSYRRSLGLVQLNIQVDEVELELDQAIPCGLILNELVSNALKYAFPDGRNGSLRVELQARPERLLTLRVADDGVGIPQDFDYRSASSLGLKLVYNLVEQLDGHLKVEQSAGTVFQISFKY